MERPRTPRWILLAALALALGGCALTLSGPAADRPRDRVPRCDTSKGLVATDAILGSVFGIAALAAASEGGGEVALLSGGLGTVFILSAVAANGRVNDCRAAIAQFEEDIASPPLTRDDLRRVAGPPGEPDEPALPARAQVGPRPMPAPARSRSRPASSASPPAPTPAIPAPAAAAPPIAPPAPAAPPIAPPTPAPPRAAVPSSDPWAEFWREL